MKSVIMILCLPLIFISSLVQADTLHLANGKTLSGEVAQLENGDYRVTLESGGTIEYSASDVSAVEFSPTASQQYKQKLSTLSQDDANAHYQLALWCNQNNLEKEALQHFANCVELDAEHRKAHLALGHKRYQDKWMSYVEVMAAKGFVMYNDRWVTVKEREWLQRSNATTITNRELAQLLKSKTPSEPQTLALFQNLLIKADKENRLNSLREGLHHEDPIFRAFCAKAFADEEKNQENFETLAEVALLDNRRTVRQAAVEGLQELCQGSTLTVQEPFIQGIRDERAAVRIASAEALGVVGGAGTIEVIIKAYRMTWGSSARNHIAIVVQHAYVEDYDVQVATGAAIADPVIGVIEEGIVLDVKPLRTERVIFTLERKIIRESYRRLVGQDIPQSWEAFQEWDAKRPKTQYELK